MKNKEITQQSGPNVRKRIEGKLQGRVPRHKLVHARAIAIKLKSKPAPFDGARREEKTSAYFVRNDDDQGESEVPGAKPAPGAPNDSKTHPCKNQMRKDGAPSVSFYFGVSAVLAGVQRDLEE